MSDEKKNAKIQNQVWDGTWWGLDQKVDYKKADEKTVEAIVAHIENDCVDWAMSIEEGGKKGGVHLQLRIWTHKRKSLGGCKKSFPLLDGCHWSMTSSKVATIKDRRYVCKNEGHIAGPWLKSTWKKEAVRMPKDVFILEEDGLEPWMKTVETKVDLEVAAGLDYKNRDFTGRSINVIIDVRGDNKKTSFRHRMEFYKKIMWCPNSHDPDKILGFAAKFPSGAYMLDMPRSMKKDKLWGLYQGVEHLKDGDRFEVRYSPENPGTQERPAVWVFTNECPDLKLLTKNRWNLWQVDAVTKELVEYVPPKEHIPTQKTKKRRAVVSSSSSDEDEPITKKKRPSAH